VDGKRYFAYIYKNGAAVTQACSHSSANNAITALTSDVIYLAANDYVELYTYQDSGGNAVLQYGAGYNYMAVHKLS
jgi:hypothetical protein